MYFVMPGLVVSTYKGWIKNWFLRALNQILIIRLILQSFLWFWNNFYHYPYCFIIIKFRRIIRPKTVMKNSKMIYCYENFAMCFIKPCIWMFQVCLKNIKVLSNNFHLKILKLFQLFSYLLSYIKILFS